jgi:Pyruvate/2-oxoacid:ferredoxin oxidoreductase delta subunit
MTVTKRQKPVVNTAICAACGECAETCLRFAITIQCGVHATVEYSRCVGCGACAAACPASAIKLENA